MERGEGERPSPGFRRPLGRPSSEIRRSKIRLRSIRTDCCAASPASECGATGGSRGAWFARTTPRTTSANPRQESRESATLTPRIRDSVASVGLRSSTPDVVGVSPEHQVWRPRFAKSLVEQTLADTPITVIQGARQVGKSTLARQVFDDREGQLLSLDSTAANEAARADPDAFVRQMSGLLVIDEVQRVPELLRAMKDAVEEDRRPGRFLVTGSANLLDVPGSQESLAGRAETVALYGLSRGEVEGHREDFVARVLAGDHESLASRTASLPRADYLEIACVGSYPEPMQRTGRRRSA
jgi:hypothetical protein